MYLEKIGLYLEQKKEVEMQLESKGNLRTQFGHNEELCGCFADWQKAFDRAKRTELMQTLKRTGIG
jgi:hypothetical protein